jgi:putative transcriptional regulator
MTTTPATRGGGIVTILGIGKTTVQQWEQGEKNPSGPALRLLDLIDRR